MANDTVQILNITNPMDLTLLGSADASDGVNVVRVNGDTLCVGTRNNASIYYDYHGNHGGAVVIYNVSNPRNPTLREVTGAWTNFTDLAIDGNYMYWAGYSNSTVMGWGFVYVVDNQRPGWIFSRGYTSLREVLGLDGVGRMIYIAMGTKGLHIRRSTITDTWQGRTDPVGTIDTPGNATDVLVDGNLAYVADGPSGVHIIDVSNPNNTAILGSYDTPGSARRLALQGKTLYVADGLGGVQILDVTRPAYPAFVDSITLPYTWEIALYAGNLIIATDAGVYSYRVGRINTSLPFLGAYDGAGYEMWDIRVQGNIAYVVVGDGLFTINVSVPSNPTLLDFYHDPGRFYRKLDISGSFVFVADYGSGGGLRSFNVSDPTNIQFLDLYALTEATDVDIAGTFAYVCGGQYFDIINATDPQNLLGVYQGSIGTSNATACWIQGYHLYIVAEQTGSADNIFLIYDVQRATSPVPPGSYDTTYTQTGSGVTYYDLYVEGDLAHAVELNKWQYWNITNPYDALGSSALSFTQALGVWAYGPYLLVAHANGIGLFDTTNLHLINTLGGSTVPSEARAVIVHGDYVYVVNRTAMTILRLFESPGTAYFPGNSYATSLVIDTVDRLIENATLTVTATIPPGTSILWQLQVGTTGWHTVTPGVEYTFLNSDNDLYWRATLSTPTYATPFIYDIAISYEYNELPSTPILYDPGMTSTTGDFTISWQGSTDPSGVVDYFDLQMSTTNTFTTISWSWSPTGTFQDIEWPHNGTYYFRVRAVDDDDEASAWSNIEDIEIAIPATPTTPTTTTTPTDSIPPIPGFPLATLVIGITIALSVAYLTRRKKR
jgi:hypothetical protein